MKEPKFKRGDWVVVTKGFERGAEGELTDYYPYSQAYGIMGARYLSVPCDAVVLAERPKTLWQRIFG